MNDERDGWRFGHDDAVARPRPFFARHPAVALALLGGGLAFIYALVEAGKLWGTEQTLLTLPLQLTLYWALWLSAPIFLLALARVLLRLRARRWGGALASLLGAALAGLVFWGVAIEPNRIRVLHTKASSACGVKVALVSDLHQGVFGRHWQLEQLVDALNAQQVDAVLVAGDWTLHPPYDLKTAFAPWTRLRHRSFGVLGHQEEAKDGPRLLEPLRETLRAAGLEWLDGRRVMLGRCELVGTGDLTSGSAARDLRLLQGQRSTVPGGRRLILTHHPDTADLLPANWAGLVLAGQTHGGQIYLPGLSEKWMPKRSKGGYIRGPYELEHTRLFVTSGIGMEDLPLRIGMPPTIDVLDL
jgi:uncharacterized protein